MNFRRCFSSGAIRSKLVEFDEYDEKERVVIWNPFYWILAAGTVHCGIARVSGASISLLLIRLSLD